jgi:predicted CopG family antitoxin
MGEYFDLNKNFYVCSYGGCGSCILTTYLSNFGNVSHIHDRYPPDNLTVAMQPPEAHWFTTEKIPPRYVKNYKVIFIYKQDVVKSIYSRFVKDNKPFSDHLKHIMCKNNGNIRLLDVVKQKTDLYELEEFYDNYMCRNKKRNYRIYGIKYEDFWNNISLFNKIMEIPNVISLYPQKIETIKIGVYDKELYEIYENLINKMRKNSFIVII